MTVVCGLDTSFVAGVGWAEVDGFLLPAAGGESAADMDDLALPRAAALSARRCSNVPRSVLPPSSSASRPEMRKSDSIRPRRFSNPSMYLALQDELATAHYVMGALLTLSVVVSSFPPE